MNMVLPYVGSSVSKSLHCWCDTPSIWTKLPQKDYVFTRHTLCCIRRQWREFLTTLFLFFTQIDFVSTEMRLRGIFSSVFLFYCFCYIFKEYETYYLYIFKSSKKPTLINFHSKKLPGHQLFSPLFKMFAWKKQNQPTNGSALLQSFFIKQISHQIQWDVTVWFALD